MRRRPMLGTHNDPHRLCWLSADNIIGRTFNVISATGTMPKLTIEASKTPVAPSAPQSCAWHVAMSRAPLHRCTSSTPERAAKSP
jgi:hypothetical protein